MRRMLPLLLAGLLLTACADDAVTRKRGAAASLTVDDFRYTPQNLSVRAGQVFLALRNTGSVATSFVLRHGNRERGRIATLEPGEVGTLTVTLKPGTYTMGSSTGRHEVLGQRGRLVVRAAP